MNDTQLQARGETSTEATAAPVEERQWPARGPLCFAHRGARAYAPENTLLAFAVACDLGADGIECDVQRSRDGRLIIIHDGLVDRTTDGTGGVAEMSFAELSTLDAGRFPRIPQRIPTLEETLDLARERKCLLNLEIKGETVEESLGTARACEPYLRSLDDAFRRRILISSFDHAALAALKEHLPWLRTGALFGKEWRGKDIVVAARALGADAIHPSVALVRRNLIARAHESGLRVHVYTVNTPHAIRQLIALGVDGIFTDYPERVLIARALHDRDVGYPFLPAAL
jgi:glycerophosphoryl diester phosphodiesterase